MSKTKIGIFGVGRGMDIARNFMLLNCDIVAVCDNHSSRLDKAVKEQLEKATKEELVLAHKYNDLHNAGKDEEIPFKAMMLTTVVAAAERMVRLENGPDFFSQRLSAIRIGDVAFCGIPGEPFMGIGRALKEADGWAQVCPVCLVNGAEGYYPMQEAYDEGGYEARASTFQPDVAQRIVVGGKELLAELKK